MDRMSPGDCFAIYSPKEEIRDGDPVQAFTAIGKVLASEVYQVESRGFKPFRRDVRYLEASPAPIRPLLEKLSITKGRGASWGQVLRRGFFEVTEKDYEVIAAAMGVQSES